MDTLAADLVADPAGEGPTPRLVLGEFDGPLALLLTMARANQIDLALISLLDLIDQLAAALQQAGPATPVGQNRPPTRRVAQDRAPLAASLAQHGRDHASSSTAG